MAPNLAVSAPPADAPGPPRGRTAPRAAAGALCAIGALALSWVLWRILLDPNGVLKLYTPMYGFSLVAVLAATVVGMSRVAEGWPLHASALPRPVRGVLLTAAAVAVTAFVVHGFFWGFLGRFGVTYFSPRAIVAAGGVGAEFFNARENASTAIVYVATAMLWMSVSLTAGFGAWPWSATSVGVRASSRAAVVVVLSAIAYATLFHPHVTQLFYPAQTFAGVPPWWAGFARTGSAYLHLGWILDSVAVLACVEILWGGQRRGAPGGPGRGLLVVLGSVAAGMGLFALLLRGMTAVWGEAFQGGQYTDAPYFRYLHAGEIAGFFVLAAYAIDTWFARPRTAGQRVAATAAAIAGTVALHALYYSPIGDRLLGKVRGFAQPEDTPLVWTLLVLALVIAQRDFFAGWPLPRRAEGA